MHYVYLTATSELPDLTGYSPCKAVVIVEESVTPDRRNVVSRWLVESGCLYMMAWGSDCRAWMEAMSAANHTAFAGQAIPDDCLIITTCHEKESLSDLFWFAKHTAMHPCFVLENVVLVHLSPEAREQGLSADYASA